MKPGGKNFYIEAAKRSTLWHKSYIESMKKKKFDSIAVHGIYSMQEALDYNQGSIIEPIYMSTSQAYRDADEMEAALGYEIPTWCYSRIANPSMYYLEGVLALLEGYGADIETSCCATASGTPARRNSLNYTGVHLPGSTGMPWRLKPLNMPWLLANTMKPGD